MAKRRKFTDQFKAKVALEALCEAKTIQEIAARHQVHSNQVSRRKRQTIKGTADVFANVSRAEGPTEAEVKKLHAKIGRLAVETTQIKGDYLAHEPFRRAWQKGISSCGGKHFGKFETGSFNNMPITNIIVDFMDDFCNNSVVPSV